MARKPVAVLLVSASGDDMMINWWNWRPLVALLVRAGILPDGEREERCLANGCGGGLSADEAARAADHVEALLDTMKPNERILLDGDTTDRPVDYQLSISEMDEEDIWNSYSVKSEVLRRFAEFCRRSGGFEVC